MIRDFYFLPLFELVYKAAAVHRLHHDPQKMQLCELLSVKTGGCGQNCKYCTQSAHHKTDVKPEKIFSVEAVEKAAEEAKKRGITRFCMGAAWPKVKDSEDFEKVLLMIRKVKALNLEPCVTLGMLTEEQAVRIKEAGCHSYNHNLDTSEAFYPEVVTTRTYQDRLNTIRAVQKAGLHLCCGGILGLGESHEDRIMLLETLASFNPRPSSIPINTLIPFPGTPLENQPPISWQELVRMVAATRIACPESVIRLSGGRYKLSSSEQAFCFFAGANSIHTSGKLFVSPTHTIDEDVALLKTLGYKDLP
jgi:biotin synthase